jgi:hypothetical protein
MSSTTVAYFNRAAECGSRVLSSRPPGCRHELANEALMMARRLGDPATLGHVLNLRSTIFPWTDPAKVRHDAAEMLAAATQLADPALTFWASFWEAIAALLTGDTRQYAAAVDAMSRLATELSQPFLKWVAAFNRSTQLRIAGRLDEAEAEARTAIEVAQAAGIADAFRFYGAGWFRLAYHRGQLTRLSDFLTRAARRVERDAITLAAFALMLCELDRTREAREVFDRIAENGFVSIPSNFMWLYVMTLVAEVCAGVRDTQRASVLYQRLQPYRTLVCHIGSAASGCVDHYLALLALTLDRLDEADAHFAGAEGMHRRMGAPIWLARTRLEWARMLLARRHTGDAERARQLLDQALTTARDLGLANIERQAVALLGQHS